jgi:hypothetical protein
LGVFFEVFLPEHSGPSFLLYKEIHHMKSTSTTSTISTEKIELKISVKLVEVSAEGGDIPSDGG